MKRYAIFASLMIALSGFLSFETYHQVYKLYRSILPDVSVLARAYPVAIRKEGRRTVYRFQEKRPAHWIRLSQVSPKAVSAVLMSEDSGFYQHHGYEPEAIRAAWEYNRRPGVKVKRGGSTITQQVVKNLFLSPEKTFTRKLRELMLAVDLERALTKRQILEIYLNIAEWGPGIYGIESASQRYFGKASADLTPREGAILAFMLPNPGKYQHSYRDGELTQFGEGRVQAILERLWRTGHIGDDEYSSGQKEGELELSL